MRSCRTGLALCREVTPRSTTGRARCSSPMRCAWVQATQPKAWDALTKGNRRRRPAVLLDRLRHQMDQRGTLDVLRHGIEVVGLRQPVSPCPVPARAGHERRRFRPAIRPTGSRW